MDITYLEHGSKDDRGAFWPHKCNECSYSVKDKRFTDNRGDVYVVDLDPEDWECELGLMRFRDLSLSEYLALRAEEEK